MQRGSAGRYIVAGASLLLLHKLSNKISGADSSQESTDQRYVMEPIADPFPVKIVPEGWHTQEEEHRKQEKEYWRKTRRYSIAAIVIAGFAAGGAFGAFFEALRQANAADDNNRPWLYIERLDASKITIAPDRTIVADLDIYVSNIGHSVASGVHVAAEITHEESLNFVRVKNYCQNIDPDGFENADRVVFPGKLNVITGSTEPYTSIYKNSRIFIIECVVYRTNHNEVHRSGAVFALNKVDTSSIGTFNDISAVTDYLEGNYAD